MGFQRPLETVHVMSNAINYRPQSDGKILLLKTPHTHVTEHEEKKFHPYLVGFMVLGGTMQATTTEK